MGKPNAAAADYVFARMTAMFGHRWTSAYGEDPRTLSGSEWSQALSELTREQVDEGFKATLVAGDKWPPTVPEFLERCVGIPTLALVRNDVRKGGCLSDFSRAVWQDLDIFQWMQSSSDRAERLLAESYQRVKARVMAGEILPPGPVAEITHERLESVAATPEQAQRHITNIRAILGLPS